MRGGGVGRRSLLPGRVRGTDGRVECLGQVEIDLLMPVISEGQHSLEVYRCVQLLLSLNARRRLQ